MFGPWYQLFLSHWNFEWIKNSIRTKINCLCFLNENVTQFQRPYTNFYQNQGCSTNSEGYVIWRFRRLFSFTLFSTHGDQTTERSNEWVFHGTFHTHFMSHINKTVDNYCHTIVSSNFMIFKCDKFMFISIPFVCTRLFFGSILEKNPFMKRIQNTLTNFLWKKKRTDFECR